MSAIALTALPSVTSAAERSRLAVQRGRAEAYAALEESFQCAERAAFALFEVEKLELLPAGVRDRLRRLAVTISSEVNGAAAQIERLKEAQ